MLTGIGLRNFKAFGDEMQEAPLSKITLIYGPNSGGKSSIIQALLLLKQSFKNRNINTSRTLVPREPLVDLGSFASLIHKHEEGRSLGISIEYEESNLGGGIKNRVNLVFLPVGGFGILSGVDYTIYDGRQQLLKAALRREASGDANLDGIYHYRNEPSWTGKLSIPGVYESYTIGWPHILRSDWDDSFLPRLALPEFGDLRDEKIKVGRFAENRELRRATNWAKELSLMIQDELSDYIEDEIAAVGLPEASKWVKLDHLMSERDEWEHYGAVTDAVRQAFEKNVIPSMVVAPDLSSEFVEALAPENIPDSYESHLSLVNYLEPLRSAPQRTYKLSPEVRLPSGVVGTKGEYTANVLYHDNALKESVNYWFNSDENPCNLGIPYKLDVALRTDPGVFGQDISLVLTDMRNGALVTIADVGYGISQALPFIIEGLASQEGAILCVEQPEIHLHPRLQANIADLMIDTIDDEPGKRKQWVVETHSELLITRLQRRIREGKIRSEDISVLYVDPDDQYTEGSAIIQLHIDGNGDFIDHWPHGFFDEAFNELMAEPENQLHPAD